MGCLGGLSATPILKGNLKGTAEFVSQLFGVRESLMRELFPSFPLTGLSQVFEKVVDRVGSELDGEVTKLLKKGLIVSTGEYLGVLGLVLGMGPNSLVQYFQTYNSCLK